MKGVTCLLCLAVFLLSSCGDDQAYLLRTPKTPSPVPSAPPIAEKEPICDPLSESGPSNAGPQNGLLTYLMMGTKVDSSIEGKSINLVYDNLSAFEQEDYSLLYENPIYLSQFGVYPRSFLDGFPTKDQGDRLKDIHGNDLVEWFRLDSEAILTLPSYMEPGKYEFAIISDDGVELKLDNEVFISNPDLHSPTKDCSGKGISLDHQSKVRFNLKYYQGPRTTISLMVMWRKVTSDSSNSPSSFCQDHDAPLTYGNQYSKVKIEIDNYMQKTGFEVIPPEAFVLPASLTNPCSDI